MKLRNLRNITGNCLTAPWPALGKKISGLLGTTDGYLYNETEQENLLKDPAMLKRLNEIEKMGPTEKGHVLFALDALIQKIKIKNIAAL